MNYTKTPNAIYAGMPDMLESELRVTLALVRLTYGYHETGVKVTYDELESATGLSRGGVTDGVKAVLKRGFFKRIGRNYFEIVDITQSTQQTETAAEVEETVYSVDQNSLPSRLNSVYSVDQNSLLSRPNHLYKEKEKEKERKHKESARASPPPADPLLDLVEHFQDLTFIPPPSHFENGNREKWLEPLVSIYRASGADFEKTKRVMSAAVDDMRGRKLTIGSPKSIMAVALGMADERHARASPEQPAGYEGIMEFLNELEEYH